MDRFKEMSNNSVVTGAMRGLSWEPGKGPKPLCCHHWSVPQLPTCPWPTSQVRDEANTQLKVFLAPLSRTHAHTSTYTQSCTCTYTSVYYTPEEVAAASTKLIKTICDKLSYFSLGTTMMSHLPRNPQTEANRWPGDT